MLDFEMTALPVIEIISNCLNYVIVYIDLKIYENCVE